LRDRGEVRKALFVCGEGPIFKIKAAILYKADYLRDVKNNE
jgi:hypothetical protein